MSNPFDFVSDGRKPYLDYQGPEGAPETHPLASMLAVAIPFRIIELQRKGGPSDLDWELAIERGLVTLEVSDLLFRGSKKQGEVSRIFTELVHAVAVMAFAPGGLTICDDHYEVNR